jgi:hypothetical protein
MGAGYNVAVFGEGPPLGSQDPMDMSRPTAERVRTGMEIRRRGSERDRRGRRRAISSTGNTNIRPEVDYVVLQSRGRRARTTSSQRGGAVGRGG